VKERIARFVEAWKQLRQLDDKALVWVVAGAFIGVLVGAGLTALLFPNPFAIVILGLMFAGLGAMMAFNLRLQKAQYAAIEGQLGAAAAVLNIMRGQWFVTPAVAVNAKQDLVHRVVGRPGIVLVGEGSPQRVKGLLAKEKKRLSRVAGEAPVTVLVVGTAEGQVPLNKLQRHLAKLPRELKKGDVPKLERKLKPLDRGMPIPKGIDPMAAANRKRPKPR
jgi:hypothetical protein